MDDFVRNAYSSKEKLEHEKVCVLCPWYDRLVRCCAKWTCWPESSSIFTSHLNVAANLLNESTFFHSEHNQSFKRHCKRFVSSASHHCRWDSRRDHRRCKRNAGGVCACRLWWWRRSWQNHLWRMLTVFIGDLSQPHSAAKSGITCSVEQFRTYMSESKCLKERESSR